MNRYEVRSRFAHKKFLGIQLLQRRIYYIYDNENDTVHDTYCNKIDVFRLCDFLNVCNTASLYLVFKDGNDKYFVCYTTKRSYGTFKSIVGVGYNKVELRSNSIYSNNSPYIKNYHKIKKNGFDTLEEACLLLEEIRNEEEKVAKIREEEKLYRKNSKKGTQVTCI